MKIAIIIVTYNAEEYIKDCLGSLFETLPKNLDAKVLVVDNNSEDKTIEIIKSYFNQVELLENNVNLGFAAGNNAAIHQALEQGAEYLYLLNQDTICVAGWLAQALKVMEGDKKIASAQSLLLLYPQKELINSRGNEIHYLGFGFSGGYRKRQATIDKRQAREITYASGAAVLLRASALRESGLFNEKFFMYHEDLDLGWRFKLAGYKNVLAPQSIIYHKYEFSRSIKKYYYMERNRFWTLLVNYRIPTLFLIAPALALMNFGLLASALCGGWFRQELRAYCYYFHLKNWRELLKSRRAAQRTRKVGDREVIKNFTGKIDFQEVANPFVKYILNPIFNWYWQIVKRVIFW